MDDKFDRIVREPFIMGGQARIRNTNITVNEIVRLSLDGTTQADILTKYPQLEAEDVHQAFVYGMKTTMDMVARYRSEVFEAITPIIGYSEIITGKTPFKLEEFPKDAGEEFAKLILLNGYRAKVRNYVLGIGTKSHFERSRENQSKPYLLHDFVREAVEAAIEHTSNCEIHYIKPENQITIFTNSYASTGLAYLLVGGYDLTENVELQMQVTKTTVRFVVVRQLLEYVSEFKFSEFEYGGLLDVANLIIFQNGSELKVQQDGDNIIFEFELLIWQDKQD